MIATLIKLASLQASNPVAVDVLRAHANRIIQCSRPDNTFRVRGRIKRAWRCNSKLCDFCCARASWKNRAKLRDAVNRQKLATGENLHFITLTIKNPNLSLVATRELIEQTWRRFTKTSLFADLFRGGAKSEEFTLTDNGFHFHLHLLSVTKYIHFNELRRVWTDCYQKSYFATFNEKSNIGTSDGMLLVKILRVTDRDNAIREVCKYITKTYKLGKLDNKALGELALLQRWNRAFELFGTFRQPNENAILDKSNLNAGSERKVIAWSKLVQKIGLQLYTEMLVREVDRRIEWFARTVYAPPNPKVA